MSFESTVAAFAAALCDPAAPPPAATRGRRDGPDERRFAVYRNNVAVGLIGALEARYPVARRVVGADGFRAIARAFIAAHKPRSPVLIAYGELFPDFIEGQGTDAGLRRLADVARLENAWVEAYHAADAPVAALADLAALGAGALPDARIALHPAARLLRFSTPAASLWQSFQEGAEPTPLSDNSGAPSIALRTVPLPRGGGEEIGKDVLVTRPEAEVSVRILPPSSHAFAKRLEAGGTLAEAAAALPDPDEFGAHLVGLVAAGAVGSIIQGICS
jgi:Putative DNA-binding domain